MRTVVVTGAASGIGRATKELLESRGERVIGVDLHDSDVVVDLTTQAGPARAGRRGPRAQRRHDRRDRGDRRPDQLRARRTSRSTTSGRSPRWRVCARCSPGRRHRAPSSRPRWPACCRTTTSWSTCAWRTTRTPPSTGPTKLVETGLGDQLYATSKVALSRWVRRSAPADDWAGSRHPAERDRPGDRPDADDRAHARHPEKRERLAAQVPMPLVGFMEASAPAGPARVAAQRGEHPPVRPGRLHRRGRRRRDPRRLDLVSRTRQGRVATQSSSAGHCRAQCAETIS